MNTTIQILFGAALGMATFLALFLLLEWINTEHNKWRLRK